MYKTLNLTSKNKVCGNPIKPLLTMRLNTKIYYSFLDEILNEIKKSKELPYNQQLIQCGALYERIKWFGRFYYFNTSQYNNAYKLVDDYVDYLYKEEK